MACGFGFVPQNEVDRVYSFIYATLDSAQVRFAKLMPMLSGKTARADRIAN
jgi:hypothetical protein